MPRHIIWGAAAAAAAAGRCSSIIHVVIHRRRRVALFARHCLFVVVAVVDLFIYSALLSMVCPNRMYICIVLCKLQSFRV